MSGRGGDRLPDREAAGMELGCRSRDGEQVISLVKGATPDPGHTSPPHRVKVSCWVPIHSAIENGSRCRAKARAALGTLVAVWGGQPEQKYGVRLIGDPAASACFAAVDEPKSGRGGSI